MRVIEPSKNMPHFSADVTSLLMRCNAALAQVTAADVWPASAEILRFNAQVGTIHYSTLIEGNRLGVLEAQRAARGELDATTKAEIELVNYVDALALLDARLAADRLAMSTELVKAVHKAATKGLGTEDGPFKPRHEGEWRDDEAGVFDPVQDALVHTGSPQPEVESRMEGLVAWIRTAEKDPVQWPPFVVAGVVHYNITDVHPFADGNGRTARLFTTAILMRHGLVPGGLFNFDAHYGRDKEAYLNALRTVRRKTLNQEWWMRYFLDGLAQEYERVAAEIHAVTALGRTGLGERLRFNESQQRGLTELVVQGRTEFSRRDYEEAASVGRGRAISDLKALADAGVLHRRGDGPNRRYRFTTAGPANPWAGRGGGRPREWTDERIDAELRQLIGSTHSFPTVKDFERAAKRDLYNAIQRNGKSHRWAEKVGVPPPRRGRQASAG